MLQRNAALGHVGRNTQPSTRRHEPEQRVVCTARHSCIKATKPAVTRSCLLPRQQRSTQPPPSLHLLLPDQTACAPTCLNLLSFIQPRAVTSQACQFRKPQCVLGSNTRAHLESLLHPGGCFLHRCKLAQGSPVLHLELAQLLPGFPLGPMRHVLYGRPCRLLPAASQHMLWTSNLPDCSDCVSASALPLAVSRPARPPQHKHVPAEDGWLSCRTAAGERLTVWHLPEPCPARPGRARAPASKRSAAMRMPGFQRWSLTETCHAHRQHGAADTCGKQQMTAQCAVRHERKAQKQRCPTSDLCQSKSVCHEAAALLCCASTCAASRCAAASSRLWLAAAESRASTRDSTCD